MSNSLTSAGHDLPALSVRRPYLAAVLNLLIIVAGVSALFGVEVRELPDVDRPTVTVGANYPGGSPETIDAEITSKVEGAVARVNGITEVRSSSAQGKFRIRATFNPSVDLVQGANDIREAISRVERELPEGVEDLFVIKADADASPIIQLAVTSDTLSIDAVTQRVEKDIIPALKGVAGVADVQITGSQKRVLRVRVDPMKLAAHGLSIVELTKILRNARYDVPVGNYKSDEQELIVRADASITEPAAIEKLILREHIRLGDVATAFFAPAEPTSITRLNGQRVIGLSIVRRAKSNTVTISQSVARVTAELDSHLKDVSISTTADEAIFIKGAISEVLTSLVLAVIIVVAVLALFLGQLKAALLPAVTIPVSLIGAVAAIWLMGFSLNLITLLALVLATGLVVDDSIVVLENVQRLRSEGLKRHAAAVVGSQQVFFAVMATTATLVCVFLPISFLPSTTGRLFAEFGCVLAVTVCISSFVALSLVPMMAARLSGGGSRKAGFTGRTWRATGQGAADAYTQLIGIVLAAPLLFAGLCCLVFFAAGAVYGTLGEELAPNEDRGVISVWLAAPPAVGLGYTDRQVENVEQILQPYMDDGVAKAVLSVTGKWRTSMGKIITPLADWSQRSLSEGAIASSVQKELSKIPGAWAGVARGNSLGLRNPRGGIRFALTGSNYEAIAEQAKALVLFAERSTPVVENLRVRFSPTQPQLSLSIDRRRAADLGVPLNNLAVTARVLIDHDEVGELMIDDESVPIIVEAATGAISSPMDLQNLYVAASNGGLVQLSQLATLSENVVARKLNRYSQRRVVEISGDLAADATLREAVEAIKRVANDTLPSDYGLIFLGEAAALDDTSYGVSVTYLIAFMIVFLVLVAQFESITSAAVVILTVPFGICAAIYAMTLTGTTINIFSQIGVLMLIGVMAKNAILMVEFADQLRERGMGVYEAAREASIARLRPITMTMLSTVLAGLPLILATGPGAEARAAIGWVVFGGLGLAGMFTLFLTPTLYVLITPTSKPRGETLKQVDAEIAEALD